MEYRRNFLEAAAIDGGQFREEVLLHYSSRIKKCDLIYCGLRNDSGI